MTSSQQLLKKYFGYDQFRGLQEQVIAHVTAGKDCLVLMPTGGGKSVCYQVPALMMEGITLVISPLISLMKDQVDALNANGIKAAFLNSSLSHEQENEIAARCFHAQIKLLYLSPEKVLAVLDQFLSKLPVALIAIDEAHCASQWGHDFRPEYKELYKLRERFPKVPMMALTATADKITRSDILELLGLREPRQFVASFDRPNISLTVKAGLNRKDKIRDITRFIGNKNKECGIVYCTSRDSTETLAVALREVGIVARSYHAGMSNEDRSKVQEAFINDDIQVVCATIAFGMGIDKSNVRFVLHYNLPRSIEGYYQEIGRGGRDGLPCETILYHTLGDLMMLRKFAQESGQPEINLEKLRRMQEFAEARHCRRRILLNYFGQNQQENCGNCDVCTNPPHVFDGTTLAQKALSALTRIQMAGEQVGSYLLTDVLRGMKPKELLDRKLDRIKTYGAGADLSARAWSHYLMQMIQLGAIEIAYNEGNVLRVTSFGDDILKGKFELPLHEFEEQVFNAKGKQQGNQDNQQFAAAAEAQNDLFEKLRKLRKQIADETGMPPYVVFHDSNLLDMASRIPHTEEEMLNVSGVSAGKMEKYGHRFLAITRTFAKTVVAYQPIEEVLSKPQLRAYMDELKQKELRFSTATIAYVLIGSERKSYKEIGEQVSFYGLLEGRLTYEQVSRQIREFYGPYELEQKQARQAARVFDGDRGERLARAEAYFNQQPGKTLTLPDQQAIEREVAAIPLEKADSTLSDGIRELRKRFFRSHEPWGEAEVTLLKEAVLKCTDLSLLVRLFGRSENSILAMSTKWIE